MGNSWNNALSTTLLNRNFEPSTADLDIWLRMSTDSRGYKYWEWIVVCVYDLLTMSEDPKAIMDSFSMCNFLLIDALEIMVESGNFRTAQTAGGLTEGIILQIRLV